MRVADAVRPCPTDDPYASCSSERVMLPVTVAYGTNLGAGYSRWDPYAEADPRDRIHTTRTRESVVWNRTNISCDTTLVLVRPYRFLE